MTFVNRFVAVLLAAAAIALLASQWRATRTENINWDEFALLSRVEQTVREGRLVGGGRPGLVVLALIPFVRNCSNSVQVIVNARQLWLAITVAYLAGVFVLILQLRQGRQHPWHGAAVAVALLVLVPVFLRWSLQVRTDQPALMFACWGGAALLASWRRLPLAAPAGILFALGYLCSQKAAYVGALVLVLFAARVAPDLRRTAREWRRGLTILSLAGASFLLTVAGFSAVVSNFYSLPATTTLEQGLNSFAYYRAAWGYRAYWGMLPSLAAHGLLLIVLIPAAFVSWQQTRRYRSALVAAGATLLLGYAIGRFHAGAFPYFWMTLGLFPAVAIGLAWEPVLDLFERSIIRGLLVGTVAVLLLIVAAPAAYALHRDTQQVQRDSLEFIERNFPLAARGFQAHSALFCRPDPSPFPTYFGGAIAGQFGGPDGPSRVQELIDEFRRRPVAFVIRLSWVAFPDTIEEFWRTHYISYRDEVMIPGRHVRGLRGASLELDVIVAGRYRWMTDGPTTARLAVDGNVVESGAVFNLDQGIHELTLLDDVGAGLVALAVVDAPQATGEAFYSAAMLREFDPRNP